MRPTSAAEVTNISKHGFWMLIDGRELFVAFEEFPWFKQATVETILRLEHPTPGHLYWPELDVDLALDGAGGESDHRGHLRPAALLADSRAQVVDRQILVGTYAGGSAHGPGD